MAIFADHSTYLIALEVRRAAGRIHSTISLERFTVATTLVTSSVRYGKDDCLWAIDSAPVLKSYEERR